MEHFPYSSLIQETTENTNAAFAILNVDIQRFNMVEGCALPAFFHTTFAIGFITEKQVYRHACLTRKILKSQFVPDEWRNAARHVQTLLSEFEWHNMLWALFLGFKDCFIPSKSTN